MTWTPERTDLLEKLWKAGLSAIGQIARKLHDGDWPSRNAVIAKVHRLGLAGRTTTSRLRTARPRSSIALFPRPPQVKRITFASLKAKAAAATRPYSPVDASLLRQAAKTIPDLEPGPEGLIRLYELTQSMCHWPIGDPMDEDFHFCGRRKSFGVPYCAHHEAIATRPRRAA